MWYPKPSKGAQLNRSHPLVRDLKGCWLFNEGPIEFTFPQSRQIENYAQPGIWPGSVSTFLTDWKVGPWGWGLDERGTQDIEFTHDVAQWPNMDFGWSVEMFVLLDSGAAINSLFGKWANSGAFPGFFLWLGSSGKLSIRNTGRTDGSNGQAEGATDSRGSWNHIVASCKGRDQADWQIWINGVPEIMTEVGTDPAGDHDHAGTSQLHIGATDGGFEVEGEIALARFWHRPLESADVNWLYRDPWDMFRPVISPGLFHTVGGAAARRIFVVS